MKTNRKTNKIYIILIVVFTFLFCLSAFMIWKNIYEAKKSAKNFEQISALVTQENEQQTQEKELTPKEVYADVYEQNNDFVGWIKIEGTKLDYPVVQTKKERDYYLRRGFDGKYSYYGVPYASEYCDVNTSSNVVIHGHNMDNGSMFATLAKYVSKSFYQEHKYITFDTLEEFGRYEIIAVFKTQVFADSEFKYFRFADGTKEEFDSFVSQCKKLSLYDTGVGADYGDRLITLSTCEYSQNHGRIAVVAKRIN